MRFDIITIFPEAFESYLNTSILKRAQEKRLIDVRFKALRDFAQGKYRQVDDKPYGGGAGMVLMAEPILRAFQSIKSKGKKTKTIIFSAKGKQFNQKMAHDWAKKYNQLVFVSGRYEGIDERVIKALSAKGGSASGGKAEEISIGPYVLTDGEVASMAVISAVARLIPGVIRLESLEEESHWNLLTKNEVVSKGLEYPHYTRPEILTYKGKKYRVPQVLLSGNHKEIAAWRVKSRG